MFNRKEVGRLKSELVRANDRILILTDLLDRQAKGFEEELKRKKPFPELMQEAFGFSVDFSEASKDKCMPPHYLEGLTEDERKSFVSDMETIYASEKFHKVVRYQLNVFGMNIVYKENKEEMKYGQVAVMAMRTLLNRFDEMHKEFLESKRNPDEDLDEQELL